MTTCGLCGVRDTHGNRCCGRCAFLLDLRPAGSPGRNLRRWVVQTEADDREHNRRIDAGKVKTCQPLKS